MTGRHDLDPEIQRQNDAIRSWYGVAEDWPEPAWLKEFLEPPPWWRRSIALPWVQVAAVIAIAVASAAGGWTIGQHGKDPAAANPHVEAFLDGHLLARGAFQSLEPLSSDLEWFAALASLAPRRSAYEVVGEGLLPDGFRVIGAQAIRGGSEDALPSGTRFVLSSPQGDRAFLYVQGRWTAPTEAITVVERNGLSLAAWEDGPLAFGLVAEKPVEEMQGLATGIRNVMHKHPAPVPAMAPSTASADLPDIPMVR